MTWLGNKLGGLLTWRLAGPVQVRDVVTALLMGVVAVGGTLGAAGNQPGQRSLDALAYTLLGLAVAAVLVWRRWPVGVLVATVVLSVVYLLAGYPYGPIVVATWFPAYTLAADHPGGIRPALAAGAAAAATLALADFATSLPPRDVLQILLVWPAMLLLPLGAGWVVRDRRDQRQERVRRQLDDERLRIARELHDVVGHSVAVINFQAGVAVHVMDHKPEQARQALVAIKEASRDAMRELRATLGVLRQLGDHDAPRTPVPGLARLEALVAHARAGSVSVTVTVQGEQVELPLAVDVAAYRIVQESLTNVLRHAGAAGAAVRLVYHPDELVVEVVDDGRGGAAVADGQGREGGGHGIAGMRERALALGGTLDAGPCGEDGGYRVCARLPLAGGVR